MDLAPTMYEEPQTKRAVAFVDGANTRLCARKAFGEGLMNLNPLALAQAACAREGWSLAGVYYYLGVPDIKITEDGYYAWMKRCARWRKQGVRVFTRTLLQDGQGVSREKGIDIRLALDAVDLYRRDPFDIALLFSQDQDFSELAAELKTLAREQGRWIEIVSAFPAGGAESGEAGGISGTRPLVLDERILRTALDTPDNRALKIERPQPPAPAAAGDVVPVFLPPLSAVPPVPRAREAAIVPQLPAAVEKRSGGRFWPSACAILYLAGVAVTLGVLGARLQDRLLSPQRPLEARLSLANQTLAQSMLWPLYWAKDEGLENFATGAMAQAGALERALPHFHH